VAGRLGAAPSELSFGDSAAQAGARPVRIDVIQAPGTMMASARTEIKRAGSDCAPGPCHFNKEQTPLASLRYQPAVSRRLFRCLGHTSSEALKM